MITTSEYKGLTSSQEQEKAALWAQHPEVFSNKWTPERQQEMAAFAASFNLANPQEDEYSEGCLDERGQRFIDNNEPIIDTDVITFAKKWTSKGTEWKFSERYYRLAPVNSNYGRALIQASKHTIKNSPEEFVQMVQLASGTAEKVEQYKKKFDKMPDNIYPCSHEFTDEEATKVLKNVVVGKHLNIQGAASFTTRKVKWLWPGRVPLGKLTLFVGVPGGGKSLAAGDVAARLSTGKNWFDSDNLFQPSETLMLVGEDDIEDTTIPRLQAAGANINKIKFLKSVITEEGNGKVAEERGFRFDKDLAQLEEALASNPRIRLVIVDPVSNYMGSAKMNAEQEVRDVLIPLKNLAERFDVAIIGIMHLNKKVETDAINRVGGAMAFVGVARAAYLFQKSEPDDGMGYLEDQHFMVLLKCNITKKTDGLVYEIAAKQVEVEGSPEYMPYIKFTATTTKNAEGVLQAKTDKTGRPPAEIGTAKTWLKQFLKDGRQKSSDILEYGRESGNFTPTTLKRAKAELGVASEKSGTTWYWYLPTKEEVSLEPAEDVQL